MLGFLPKYESSNVVSNLNSALRPRCPPGVAAEHCTSVKQSQHSCVSKKDAGIALLELLLIVEADVHNQSTLFWMSSHLALLFVALPAPLCWEQSCSHPVSVSVG